MKEYWINHPTVLEGQSVQLIPLEIDQFDELVAASSDPVVWEHLAIEGYKEDILRKALFEAIQERNLGNAYPFVIISKEDNRIIGSTRYFDIHVEHRKLEIGWTWIQKDFWGSGINTEIKYIMLKYAFEHINVSRVQIKTGDTNIRSQRAIEKLGAKFEGILRKDRIRPNGSFRNSVYYSILSEEWPEVKHNLEAKLLNSAVMV